MERDRPEIMYLSTTDYIQHKHAPGTPVANDFYAMMDGYMAKLDALGCTIVLTADHGMNAKFGADGQPDVIYLQDLFDGWVGKDKARVILPITDPYVVHHGALGSYAVVYCDEPEAWAAKLKAMPASRRRSPRQEARALRAAGRSAGRPRRRLDQAQGAGHLGARHDLSGLTEPLRSHGGISEQQVPLLCNRKLARRPTAAQWRNFDAFDLALNLVA
jgi:phosphonoacetate hydrolase